MHLGLDPFVPAMYDYILFKSLLSMFRELCFGPCGFFLSNLGAGRAGGSFHKAAPPEGSETIPSGFIPVFFNIFPRKVSSPGGQENLTILPLRGCGKEISRHQSAMGTPA